jgi:hypothetical protein
MPLSAEEVLFRVAQDAGPFLKLGGGFKSSGAPWTGPAIASPLAIYLVKNAKAQSHSYGGGLVGALLAQALAKDDGISTCSTEDLPQAVKDFVYPKKKVKIKDVVIVPWATVSYVKSTKWNNAIEFTAGHDKFTVNTSLLSMWKRARQLRELGWTLNTTLVPEAEAVHDTRTPDLKQVKVQPMWKKVGLVALAILIIVAVIALRVMADH